MPAVVRLVTLVAVDGPDTGQLSVSARHEAVLDDGRRVLLLDDRGWASTQPWHSATPDDVVRTTRTVVGPDEPYGDRTGEDAVTDHWSALCRILHGHGVDAAGLGELPHDVELDPDLLSRLAPG